MVFVVIFSFFASNGLNAGESVSSEKKDEVKLLPCLKLFFHLIDFQEEASPLRL